MSPCGYCKGVICKGVVKMRFLARQIADSFVSVRFRPVYEDEDIDGDVTAEVYQPTEQCIELVRKQALVDSSQASSEG